MNLIDLDPYATYSQLRILVLEGMEFALPDGWQATVGRMIWLIEVMEQVPSRFEDLGLSEDSLTAIRAVGYQTPSPIQAAFIPIAVSGKDCIGQARTGTGKTAAFVLPMLERMDFDDTPTQVLVLTPTRELSQQVADEAVRLSINHDVTTACCVGGRPLRPQITQLERGAQIVIGTPGRVIDLMTRNYLKLGHLRVVVLDEADRMLDIGFRPDIEKILRQVPPERQTLLLSATLPPPVERLARRYMRDPERIDMSIDTVNSDTIDQYYVSVDPDRKFRVLVQLLIQERPQQAIVFTRTKRGAEEVFRRFSGRLPQSAFIHGDLAQSARDRVMKQFRDGQIRLLIATDVMGRGIDVSGISHIINFDIPEDCDDYVHRIGRTGRLSSHETKGSAFTFVSLSEGDLLTNIEKRVDRMLEPYTVKGYEPHVSRPKRQHVDDLPSARLSVTPVDDEEFWSLD
ncbi:MAG: DEAD/DEAH box helicase [Planctomycetota bacterium]